MAMRKVNKGYLRYFGDTKKGKLFNNEIDILALLIILVFIGPTTTYAGKEEE